MRSHSFESVCCAVRLGLCLITAGCSDRAGTAEHALSADDAGPGSADTSLTTAGSHAAAGGTPVQRGATAASGGQPARAMDPSGAAAGASGAPGQLRGQGGAPAAGMGGSSGQYAGQTGALLPVSGQGSMANAASDLDDGGIASVRGGGEAVACATRFASCTLGKPAALDQCLAAFSNCSVFRTGDAASIGCATEFSACVVADAPSIDVCLQKISACEGQAL